jgi:hypothetical protein
MPWEFMEINRFIREKDANPCFSKDQKTKSGRVSGLDLP